jgi:hypothetical protein
MVSENDESIFEQALLEAGDRNGVVASHDLLDGWRQYWEEYDTNPDICRCTVGAVEDMYMDSVLRDIIVTEETIYMTPSVAPELNLELFKQRKSDEAFGLIMGMEIIIDGDFDRNEIILYEREYGVTERSVVVRG